MELPDIPLKTSHSELEKTGGNLIDVLRLIEVQANELGKLVKLVLHLTRGVLQRKLQRFSPVATRLNLILFERAPDSVKDNLLVGACKVLL